MRAFASGADELLRRASPLAEDAARLSVPEPAAKALLRARGIATPRGEVVALGTDLAAAAERLREPLVLKAFGPGIVHKSDVGAVRLGLRASELETARREMDAQLRRCGCTAAGFLLEEQHAGGLELIVGVVRRPPFGPVALLGLGGRLVEALDQNVLRLCPLDERAADEMLDSFPGAALLAGTRGFPPADRAALRSVLLALAGTGGIAEQLGASLAELECNPVVATPNGAVALDARLIVRAAPEPTAPAPEATDFTRLFAPRAIAVAGASTQRAGFGNRFLAAYRALGWRDGLYAIHPEAKEIDGVAAVRSAAEIPGGVDYLLGAVPAQRCARLLQDSAGHVRFAQVISGGFGESGADGAALERELVAAARAAGMRLLGPNCMGVFSPRGRQAFQLGVPTDAGSVSVISQSGGLAGDIVQAGARRGIRFAKLASVGNCADVGAGELLGWLVDDAATTTIGLYLEGPRDGERLLRALRRAAGKKPVVILAGGLSRQGAGAAASHTGALSSDARVWGAVSAATGASLATTLEEFLGALAFLERHAVAKVPASASVLVAGPGGGASVLATDACDRAGLELTRLSPAAVEKLRAEGYGAGTSLANPLELPVGPATAPDALPRALGALLSEQPFADVLVHVNVQSYYGYGDRGADPLAALVEQLGAPRWPQSRLACVLRNLECAPARDREALASAARQAGLSTFASLDEAARAIAAAKRFTCFRVREGERA